MEPVAFDKRQSSTRSKALLFLAGAVLIGLIWFLDYVTGKDISFSIFYLIPIALVTWRIGKYSGLIFSMVSAIAWFLADKMAGGQYSNFLIPYWNATVRLGFFVVTVFALARVKKDLELQTSLASNDSLTGLANSQSFLKLAGLEIARSRRSRRPLTIAYLDCDNFKEVNDTYGHQAGDEVLCLVAEQIRTQTRTTDIKARIGGDEYIILLADADEIAAREVIKRLQDRIASAQEKKPWTITLSIGAVTFSEFLESLEEMIRRADHLMYEVKQSGKNGIQQEVVGKSAEVPNPGR